jgi:hypothetical protein
MEAVLGGQLALIAAALFTGAAVYVNVAKQPARLALDDRALLAECKAAYHRGFTMQGPLALIGFSLGLIRRARRNGLALGRGSLHAPCQLAFHAHCHLADEQAFDRNPAAKCGPKSRELIRVWGRLHAVRSGLGATATVLFLWASIQAWLAASLQ